MNLKDELKKGQAFIGVDDKILLPDFSRKRIFSFSSISPYVSRKNTEETIRINKLFRIFGF